jgi:outer membrane protein OmpA-like peptidoglycan-associated protein
VPEREILAIAPTEPANKGGAALLRFSLKQMLYVGETYTLEVLETDEMLGTTREFIVEFVEQQIIEVPVSRTSRDVRVTLRLDQDDAEPTPVDRIRIDEAITIVAKHKALGLETSSGVTREGAALLPGADALYVGQTYVFEVGDLEGSSHVSARTTEITISAGKEPLQIQVPIGPSAGRVHLLLRDPLKDTQSPLANLPMPRIHFSIFPKPRTGRLKFSGTTDAQGRFTLEKGAQMYVGRSYTVEVSSEQNKRVVSNAIGEFTILKNDSFGDQTVRVDVHRALGDVTAIFTTVHAHSAHWASFLKLPAPFEYRIVHKKSGAVVHQETILRQPSHTVRQELPAKHRLFVEEAYYMEVGYQMRQSVAEATEMLRKKLHGRTVEFLEAGPQAVPDVATSWSLDLRDDALKVEANCAVIDTIVEVLNGFPALHLEVHVQTGRRHSVDALAAYYKMRDLARLLDHLARNRASACVEALRKVGVGSHRLRATFRGGEAVDKVEFRLETPRSSRLGDPLSGLTPKRIDFTVASPALTGASQEVSMALEKATGDLNVLFRSAHPEPAHWSHFLRVPPGLRVVVRHTASDTRIVEGVVSSGDESKCVLLGSQPSRQLYCQEHYTLDLEGGSYFAPDPNALLLRAGVQDVVMRVTWATRMVRCYLSSADANVYRSAQAQEAYARIRAFLEKHDIIFDGAADSQVVKITQAWSIHHSDPQVRAANLATISGVAGILKAYPNLRIEVHGKTGAAESAPRRLADHFAKHPKHDVQELMDKLAMHRAQACLEALVHSGVPASQLYVSFRGRDGASTVDFIPEGTSSAPSLAGQPVQREMARLPAGIPFEVRLKAGGTVLHAGMTTKAEPEVLVPLPHKERLIVGQTYVFEAFAGPGTDPNLCEFTIDPDQVHDLDILEIRLPVRRAAAGALTVRCRHAVEEGHWSRKLPMPVAVSYHVLDHVGTVASMGQASGHTPTPLNTFGLIVGQAYRLRVPQTRQIVASELTDAFTMGRDDVDQPIVLSLRRQTAPVTLVVEASERASREGHWSAALPLPPLFDIVLVHAGLGEVVSEFLVEGETGRLCRRELDRSQLYVDEKYVVQLGCSSRVQLDRASAQLGALLKSRAIRFASAADKGLRAIEEAWSVDHPDQTLKAQNHILLDEIARILGEHPGVALEVHGESARLDEAPDALARYYKRRPKEDAQLLSMHLARNRSEACVRALVARNKTLEKRLSVCRARTGKPQTEFVPSALLGLSGTGFQPTVAEFKVAANTELMTTRSQEVRVSVERQTGDVLIKLVNARAETGHWSSALAVASGVPISIRHKKLNLEVLRETVFDGELLLKGTDLFYVHEVYTVHVAATIRTEEAVAELTVFGGTSTTLKIPIHRPSRRVELSLASEQLNDVTVQSAARAREQITRYLIDHDIFFNGAADPLTQSSPLGVAQAWNIEHLEPKKRDENGKILDTIAAIMKQHKEIALEIAGSTTKQTSAEALGNYFRLHPTDDVTKCLDLLARQRGDACFEALVRRGVEAARMWVTSHPQGEAMKVDFIPHASSIKDRYSPLPAGVPFRLLHQRQSDGGLRAALSEMRSFTERNVVEFNGAGEQLADVQQAWSVQHLDRRRTQLNLQTLQGVAAILQKFPEVYLEVRGETGGADAAPRQLASYLSMDRIKQVGPIMDKLAEMRAKACIGTLVQLGIRRERLLLSFNGNSKHLRVEFLPRSMRPYAPLDEGPVPELALVFEGVTQAAGQKVQCPLPPNTVLHVDETYVLQVRPVRLPSEPDLVLDERRAVRVNDPRSETGASHFQCVYRSFSIKAESKPEDVCVEQLIAPRVRRGTIKVTAADARYGKGDWTEALQLPGSIPFHVYRVIETPAEGAAQPAAGQPAAGQPAAREAAGAIVGMQPLNMAPSPAAAKAAPDRDLAAAPVYEGTLHPTRPGRSGAVFQADKLEPGVLYELRVLATSVTKPASVRFVESAQAVEVGVRLERAMCDVKVYWAWPTNAWYANMELPAAVPYQLYHLGLKREVQRGMLRHTARAALTAQQQLVEADTRIRTRIKSEVLSFNSAADDSLGAIEHSWSLDYEGDDTKRQRNHELLDELARLLLESPEVALQVDGETALVREAPERLAQYYRRRAREDARELCEQLATNRANACVDALIRRGIPPERLLATCRTDAATGTAGAAGATRARTGASLVHFVPMALADMAEKHKAHDKRREHQASSAAAAVATFLQAEEHRVVFNGASEDATKSSSRGLAQSWSIEHLNQEKQLRNLATLEGIASIMLRHPEASLEVHGQTTYPEEGRADEDLAALFKLRATEDCNAVMDLLAKKRATACLEHLVSLGVPRRNLYLTYRGGQGHSRVDFRPQQGGKVGRHVTDDVLTIFRTYDKDSSGSIDLDELSTALSDLKLSASSREIVEIMQYGVVPIWHPRAHRVRSACARPAPLSGHAGRLQAPSRVASILWHARDGAARLRALRVASGCAGRHPRQGSERRAV